MNNCSRSRARRQHKAYAPYSSFHVGCAVESVDGEVVTGANMENACYRLGLCAEQSALTAAQHAFGLDKVARIAVVGGSGDDRLHALRRLPPGDPRSGAAQRPRRRDPVRQRRRQPGRALHHRRADPVRLRPGEPRRVGTGLDRASGPARRTPPGASGWRYSTPATEAFDPAHLPFERVEPLELHPHPLVKLRAARRTRAGSPAATRQYARTR